MIREGRNRPASRGSPPLAAIGCWLSVSLLPVLVFAGETTTMKLDELWRIGGDSGDDRQFFGVIVDLDVDDEGFVHVVDQQLNRISVFAPDGSFVRRIGGEGDGPGEFRRPYRIFVSPTDEVCVIAGSPRRIQRFSHTGEYRGDIAIPADDAGVVPVLMDVECTGDRVVALSYIKPNSEYVLPGARVANHVIHALDERFQETARYHAETVSEDDSKPVWSERPSLASRWDVGADGRVHVATDFLDYRVASYLPDGAADRVITREYKHRRRSAAEKRAVHEWATLNPNSMLPGTEVIIEEFDKDVMSLHARDDGTLWVLTSRGMYDRPTGSLGVFDVFDRDGEYVGQRVLLGEGDPTRDRYFFKGDRLYVVTCFTAAIATMVGDGEDNRFSDACDEPMSVICYDLGTKR